MSFNLRSRRLGDANNSSKLIPSASQFKARHEVIYVSSEEENENVENCDMNTKKSKWSGKTNNAKMLTSSAQVHYTPKKETKKNKEGKQYRDADELTENSQVSPPKQSRVNLVPETLSSPSRLLDRLSIDNKYNKAPINESQLNENSDKYQKARRILSSTETYSLPGREQELIELEEFIIGHLKDSTSGSLYISGQPGTGKTACISKLLKSKKIGVQVTQVFINCTSISSIGSIYKKICNELKVKAAGKTEKEHIQAIRSHLNYNRKMVVMVLDEIDQLCGKQQSVLYTIFEWPAIPNSKLILIGIANSLDLIDRLLVRLNAKCELKPKLMHFGSYTKQQIIDIFKSRLEEDGVSDVFPAVTIQLLAAKVSAISGDVRRALDIGRRVIDLAKQQGINGKANLDFYKFATDKSCSNTVRPEQNNIEPVNVHQVVSVLKEVYGASQNLHDDIEEAFPLQQKILLCCLMLMLRNQNNKDITLGRLHDIYKRVCLKRNILAVDQSEFSGCIDLVETRGIIRVIRKKEPRLNKIQLQWDEEEINTALCDKQLIASILEDSTCLTK